MKTVCYENASFDPAAVAPVLTLMEVPKRYVPIHRCMHIKINYVEVIPSIGPHRPLWARYGTYSYCPTQRWLHNGKETKKIVSLLIATFQLNTEPSWGSTIHVPIPNRCEIRSFGC